MDTAHHHPPGMHWQLTGSLPSNAWPAVITGDAAGVLGLLLQLEQSQWLAPEQLQRRQLAQLDLVLRHAWETVPHYREHWAGRYDPSRPLDMQAISQLPLLTRRDLQQQFDRLKSSAPPAAHGDRHESRSSGSTGTPVRVLMTELQGLYWKAFTLREHAWRGRDLGAKLGAIRHGKAEGHFDHWGPATEGMVHTGPLALSGIRVDVAAHVAWIGRERPDYLLTYPSVALELLRHSQATGFRPQGLRELRTYGELVTPELRAMCAELWGVPLADMYSADETGYLALQCGHGSYHVQSEGVLLEVLDDGNRPCAPGVTGRVVVTSLHNFAMPLVRYDLGDLAEYGAPCACGRGLPVLSRIAGRARNTLVMADGRRYWPLLGSRRFIGVVPVVQMQLVQKSFIRLEALLVVSAPLTAEDERRIRAEVLATLPDGLQLDLRVADAIPRGPGGKFEDFVSEVAAPVAG